LLSIILLTLFSCTTYNAPKDISFIWKDIEEKDFYALHSQVDRENSSHLILGNIPIKIPASKIATNLSSLSGRWEGYDDGGPVANNRKVILVFPEIKRDYGKGYCYASTNLQFPMYLKEFYFEVLSQDEGRIRWNANFDKDNTGVFEIQYIPELNELHGTLRVDALNYSSNLVLRRKRDFFIYDDYEKYLNLLNISIHEFENLSLKQYGNGFMLYLPEDYELSQHRTFPLIYFLHGSGDRGKNLFLLAEASPFMMVRQGNHLPFILAAPILKKSDDFRSFPDVYLRGVYDEIIKRYRVNSDKVYVTGISMGGEATYRFALKNPGIPAAIAPLSAADPEYSPEMQQEGFIPFKEPMSAISHIPVFSVHGENDVLVPLEAARKTVSELQEVNNQVEFHIIKDNGHDTWTTTYSDEQFYIWLLGHTGK